MTIVSDVEFDESKHYLSVLCKREHDYRGTGQSIRMLPKKRGTCCYCAREKALDRKRNRTDEQKEKDRESQKRHYHQKSKNDPAYKAKMKAYREENKEKLQEYLKEWRKNNRHIIQGYQECGKTREWAKKYYSTERGRFTSIQKTNRRRQRKRKKGSEKYTQEQRDSRYLLFDNCCAYCGQRDVLTIEHVVPLHDSRGYDRLDNIIPACVNCNCYRKSRRKLVEWYFSQEFFQLERFEKILSVLGEEEVESILEDIQELDN